MGRIRKGSYYPTLKTGDTIQCKNKLEASRLVKAIKDDGQYAYIMEKEGKSIVVVERLLGEHERSE